MTEVLDIIRGGGQLAGAEARHASELWMQIVEAAPLEGEATEVTGQE